MANYKIYHAKFWTLAGTPRVYVGHTRSLDLRKLWAEKKPPPPIRCRDPEKEFIYKTVEDEVQSKPMFLLNTCFNLAFGMKSGLLKPLYASLLSRHSIALGLASSYL